MAAPSDGSSGDSCDYGPEFGTGLPPGRIDYLTRGGVAVTRTAAPFDPAGLAELTRAVDRRRGGVFSSGMEYPGRYSRWHIGYVNPCLEVTARGRVVTATALNDRGAVLLPAVSEALLRAGERAEAGRWQASVSIPEPAGLVPEEQRSRRPTVFTAVRELIALFAGPEEHLGLFGSFGYDLAFQFEPVRLRARRPGHHRDMVLHLPDELFVIDRKRETALKFSYDFAAGGRSTQNLPRTTPATVPAPDGQSAADLPADPVPGAFAGVVTVARERFAAGDLFEVVPSHSYWTRPGAPSGCYELLRRRNPAPYEFFLNLGAGEYLVGASPEMYVRVTGDRVETCPIAGTAPRGASTLEDADNIRGLLSSAKDESELTMCTDVDRNDKSRICVPGSVAVIGRRQIELYSRVIHTVDHVEGRLRPGLDALDAFLSHMWAVTVTGAPKTWAMRFIEEHEDRPREWYGGAVGVLGFDGSMNTGLTLRTAHIRDGVASVRTGATLLFDSDPAAEERETQLKARALLDVLRDSADPGPAAAEPAAAVAWPGPGTPGPDAADRASGPGAGLRVLLVDHQDSFVHTLGSYFAEHGAAVTTLRAGFDPAQLDEIGPGLVVLSPGPGRPSDFDCAALLAELDARSLPVFGVCLGLQAMVEYGGGRLRLLAEPAHGKPGTVRVLGGELLAGLPAEFTAGRYHSLHARPGDVTGGFAVTAVTPDGVVMAIEDAAIGWCAVQFHPESILTASGRAGHRVIANVLRMCRSRTAARRASPLGGVPAGAAADDGPI